MAKNIKCHAGAPSPTRQNFLTYLAVDRKINEGNMKTMSH